MRRYYIGLVSDSHGRLNRLERMADAAPDVSAWLHGGDYCEDSEALASYTGVPVYAVRGNNDFHDRTYPDSRKVTIEGVSITVIHGHQWYGSNRFDKLSLLGRKNKSPLVMFGHTHRCFLEKKEGVLVVNPGSISLSRDSRKGTYGICTIEDGAVTDVKFYELD